MAASSSVANEIGFRSGLGHISVTNTATEIAKGTAMIRARIEETMVPKINGSAPKAPFTGSHALDMKKWNPNFCHARAERWINSDRVSPTTASTVRAAASISPWKPVSRVKKVLVQAGVFCAVFTSEILGDSGVAMFFVDLAPKTRADGFSSGRGLSGGDPISFSLHLSRATPGS